MGNLQLSEFDTSSIARHLSDLTNAADDSYRIGNQLLHSYRTKWSSAVVEDFAAPARKHVQAIIDILVARGEELVGGGRDIAAVATLLQSLSEYPADHHVAQLLSTASVDVLHLDRYRDYVDTHCFERAIATKQPS